MHFIIDTYCDLLMLRVMFYFDPGKHFLLNLLEKFSIGIILKELPNFFRPNYSTSAKRILGYIDNCRW